MAMLMVKRERSDYGDGEERGRECEICKEIGENYDK